MTRQAIADFRKEIFARIVKGLRALESQGAIPTDELHGLSMMCLVHQSAMFEDQNDYDDRDDSYLLAGIDEAAQHLRNLVTRLPQVAEARNAALAVLEELLRKAAMA